MMIAMRSGEQKCQNGPQNQMISKLCLENRNFFSTAWPTEYEHDTVECCYNLVDYNSSAERKMSEWGKGTKHKDRRFVLIYGFAMSCKGKFTRDSSAINHWNYLENEVPKISFIFPRGQWVNCNLYFVGYLCEGR